MLKKAFKFHVLGVIFFLSLVIGCGQQKANIYWLDAGIIDQLRPEGLK
jgi:hypothetical protein